MEKQSISESLLVGFDLSSTYDASVMTVVRTTGGDMEIMKTFVGKEAEDMYEKLGGSIAFENRKVVDYLEEQHYRRRAKKAAMDLQYSDEVLDAIDAAKNDAEIGRIMTTARNKEGFLK